MNNCKWLSDEFTYVCCCGDNRRYCADACPFYERPNKRECRFYEEGKDVQRRDSVPPSWTARGYATCAGGDRIDIFWEEEKMTLDEIFELCKSNDFKERTRGEYYFVHDKYKKLHDAIIKREAGKIDFTPNCPIEQWEAQEKAMGEYLHQLEIKAIIENIKL